MKKSFYSITFILIILYSCTKEEETAPEDFDIPVVEAFLEPGGNVMVKLSKMLPFTEDEYTESLIIDNAQVYINYNETDYLLSPVNGNPGHYENLNSNLTIISGGTYSLFFDYNGSSVTSTTSIPKKPVNVNLNNIIFEVDTPMTMGATQNTAIVTWDNPDNSYYQITAEYLESSYTPINENFDSETFADFQKTSTDPISGNLFNLNTRQHLLFFGNYRIIVYKINLEYVNLYEDIGQSSQNLTEPLTNINNGLGIFTGLNSDTLLLEVKGI